MLSPANSSISWLIKAIVLAAVLVGCSGMEPRFIYTPDQFNQTNDQVQKLAINPIQKYLVKQAITDAEKSDLETALPLIDEMIRYDPITINSYSLKGKILRALGRDAEAKAAFVAGMATAQPKTNDEQDVLVRSDLLLELAQLHMADQEIELAQTAAERSIKLSDTSPIGHTILAQIAQKKGNVQLAKEECMRALLSDADYEPARLLYRELNGLK